MSKIIIKNQLTQTPNFNHLTQEGSFLNILLYLTQSQPDKIEYLCHFLQKYHIKLGFFTKEKRFYFSPSFYVNANFIAQSTKSISETDFAEINNFLSSEVIIVSIFYQNQVWSVSRFLKWYQIFSQKAILLGAANSSKNFDTQFHVIKKNKNQFVPLWLFFNQRFF